MMTRKFYLFVMLTGAAIVAVACGNDGLTVGGIDESAACFAEPSIEAVSDATASSDATITLATHDSFALSEGTLDQFTASTGITVEQIAVGDAGQLVSQSILTAGNPTADVLFGIDNNFLCRGLEADLFVPYTSPATDQIDGALRLDPHDRVTPINFGDVCVNYWTDSLPGDIPTSLDDLIDPINKGQFVTENPETSSPGFAFLLATIAKYGEDGWEDYWTSLVENDVSVTAGWSEAYYGEFISGGGSRSIVTSYGSSPPFDLFYAEDPPETPPSAVLTDGCYRQIEFAGILNGTAYPAEAAALIDFMLGETYQNDLLLNQFVYPANTSVELPEVFTTYGPKVEGALTLDPAAIEANRSEWTSRWNEIVFG